MSHLACRPMPLTGVDARGGPRSRQFSPRPVPVCRAPSIDRIRAVPSVIDRITRAGPAVPGSRSSWPACAVPPARVSTPRPGWSQWPATGTRNATSGQATCTAGRGNPASFNVVTSFRGIWGTTPEAVAEIYRVLSPGGRSGITVWGHLKASPGAWASAPFRLAAAGKSRATGGDGVARPAWCGRAAAGVIRELAGIERLDVPFTPGSRTRSCTRAHWPPPARLMRPFRTSARLSSIA